MAYLKWQVIKYVNSRSMQYTMKDLKRILTDAGCTFEPAYAPNSPTPAKMILTVIKPVKEGEDPCKVRKEVTDAMRLVHPNLPRKFKGLME